MMYGVRRSTRPADATHPLGYGHELYFWTLLVGVLIFGLGGGMSIVTGVVHILHRTAAESSWWSYAVLGTAAVFESVSWYFGMRAFSVERRGRGVIESIVRTKNPTAFAVLLEDSAALLGLAIAFIGVYLSTKLQLVWIDGASSILIGLLLCGIAIVMVRESMGLLVGEGMENAALDELRRIVGNDPNVRRVAELLTFYVGPRRCCSRSISNSRPRRGSQTFASRFRASRRIFDAAIRVSGTSSSIRSRPTRRATRRLSAGLSISTRPTCAANGGALA